MLPSPTKLSSFKYERRESVKPYGREADKALSITYYTAANLQNNP